MTGRSVYFVSIKPSKDCTAMNKSMKVLCVCGGGDQPKLMSDALAGRYYRKCERAEAARNRTDVDRCLPLIRASAV